MPHVLYSQVLEARAQRVWALIRDFGGLAAWLPGIERCELRDGARPDQLGAVRVITRADGIVVEETLQELSDHRQYIEFALTKGDVPTHNARARIRVHEVVADGRAYVEWHTSFDVATDPAPVVAWVRDGFLRPALAALERAAQAGA